MSALRAHDLKTHLYIHSPPDSKMQMAAENMVQNAVQPKGNDQDDDMDEWENDDNDENCNDAEFEAINAQLDQLNSILDNLERKNDVIHAELVELLKSNREARKQFQESQEEHTVELQKPKP